MALKKKHGKIKFNLLVLIFPLLILPVLILFSQQKQTVNNYAADPQPLGVPGTWQLTFDDEFNGTALDTTKWIPCYPGWNGVGCGHSNNELQWYQPANVTESGGLLHLSGQKQTISPGDGKTYNYTSGMVASSGKFSYTYGYAEIRFKSPKGLGYWPAFWTLPEDGSWPPEIDAMEILGNDTTKAYLTYHWLTNGVHLSDGSNFTGPDFSTDFHVIGIDWQPNAIVWYLDGVEKKRFTNAAVITNKPMYVLANLAIGGDWPGNPDATTVFPQNMDIDYIRVWNKTSDTSPSITVNPTQPTSVTPTYTCLSGQPCTTLVPTTGTTPQPTDVPSPTMEPTLPIPTFSPISPTVEVSINPTDVQQPTSQPANPGNGSNSGFIQILIHFLQLLLELLQNLFK